MATPEDLRAFDAKKGEVNIGKLFFMMSLDLIASHIFIYIGSKMYKSKTRLVTCHSTLVAFCDIANKSENCLIYHCYCRGIMLMTNLET